MGFGVKVKLPEVGATVRVIGETGTYIVMRMDARRYLADLMLVGPSAKLEQGIHISAIEPVSARGLSHEVMRSVLRPRLLFS